jgi:cell wall-associated NlpC family hydrolase
VAPASLTDVAPPAAVAAFAPGVPTSSPIVWVPDWGIYLRGGQDVVLYRGVYYRYDDGQWYASRSARGPWMRLESPHVSRHGSESQDARIGEGRPVGSPPPVARDAARGSTRDRDAAERSSAPRHEQVVVVERALAHVGAPYRWGGSTPAGFDCSGFVRHVYARAGIALPRTVAAQYRIGVAVGRHDLRPGDLVFFDRLRHNGIYIGQGEFIHASSGAGRVSVSRLDEPWFQGHWSGARRIRATSPTDGHVTRAGGVDVRGEAPAD